MPVRGNQANVSIKPPSGDGTTIMRIGQLAAEGYRADAMIVCMDTYTAGEMMNPYTMKPWVRGDMEYLATHHDGIARGWVRDALMVLFVRRDGTPSMYTMAYKRTETGVEWLSDKPRGGGEEDDWHAAGPMTTMMEPLGVFSGLESPSDHLVGRFLSKIGATVEEW
jgi:hypothetical protein